MQCLEGKCCYKHHSLWCLLKRTYLSQDMFKIFRTIFDRHTNKFAKPWEVQPKPRRPYFDRRVKRYSFFVGQKVASTGRPRPLVRQKHRKLTRVWTGPWAITSFRSPIVVQLRDINSGRKQIVHVDRIVPCLNQETEIGVDVVEQTSQSPTQTLADTQPTPSYLAEHQTSTDSQDVDSQSSYGRTIRRPMRYR